MKEEKHVDYKLIFHLIINLEKIKSINEPMSLLLQLLFRENVEILDKLSNINPSTNYFYCGNDKFNNYKQNISVSGSRAGLETGQHVDDFIISVYTKCKYSILIKPDYWS